VSVWWNRNLCHYEYPGLSNSKKSFLLQTENDISVLVIINLIFVSIMYKLTTATWVYYCAVEPPFFSLSLLFLFAQSSLFSQVDKKKKINTNFMHHIFRCFDDNRLKTALSYVRSHRLISFNKCTERSRSSYLPIGQGVYHLSMT
jgi:hypothetical protein